MTAYTANQIFTGNGWLTGHSVLVHNGQIEDIVPDAEVPLQVEQIGKDFDYLVPAFIDLQIYGAGGKLFNMSPTVEALEALRLYCVKGGAHHFMPTVATNTYQVFYQCIDAIRQYWAHGRKGVLGLHIEGPWINKVKRGAHVEDLVHAPDIKQVTDLLEYGKDIIKMITLAPEVCSKEVIDLIQSHGIVVSLGHSNASYAEATKAFNEGIPVATHLYNAMSPLQHRQPGVVGAVLNHATARASIIPDGHHVDFEAVAIAKKIMGERLFMITDAVTETNGGPYPHQREGDKYVSNGILSGSALTLLKGVKNCVSKVGIPLDEALKMASLYPAAVMGWQSEIGVILKGSKANMLLLNDHLDILEHVGG